MTEIKRNAEKDIRYRTTAIGGGFFDMISSNLILFQLIEETIKGYLDLVSEIISGRSKDIPFKLQLYKKRDGLGKLIIIFKQLNDNKKLIEDLAKVAEDRNIVAHKIGRIYFDAISNTIKELKNWDKDSLEKALKETTSKHISEQKKVLRRAGDCIGPLQEEYQRIFAIRKKLLS
jgi:hypothetical protein